MIDVNAFTSREPFHGAKGLVFFGEKILVFRRDKLVKNDPNKVDLPGGAQEEGETPFETFRREIEEDFGFTLLQDDVVSCKAYPSIIDPTVSAYFFVAKPTNISEDDIVWQGDGFYFDLISPEEFSRLSDGVSQQQERTKDFLRGRV